MFSKYKKDKAAAAVKPDAPAAKQPEPEAAKPAPAAVMRKAAPQAPAQVTPIDKERKRKERMAEIKLDLHRVLLDSLNLSALEHASEQDLRQEISAIASEHLQAQSIVLNREDSQTLT